jgi:hypothetical protein
MPTVYLKRNEENKKPVVDRKNGRNGVFEETKKRATQSIKVGQSSTNSLTDTCAFSKEIR